MNGYFQLVNETSGTSLMLYPPTDGGDELDISEVVDYLGQKDVAYDQSAFYAAAKGLKGEPLKVSLSGERCRPIQEMAVVRIASNSMYATVRFYAPSSDGAVMEKDEILNDLKYRGVTYGIQDLVLEDFLRKREYCKDIEIAVGTDRTNGVDAEIEYQFNTDNKARPTLKEDGSVDFFHLNTVNSCSEGQLLAKRVPGVPAKPGMDVRGGIIQAGETKSVRLKYGKNVAISDDGNELYSLVNGHIIYEDGRVSVSDVLDLSSVDSSTGNIDYTGSIRVTGNICENYSVSAKGNVIVDGVVEGAEIKAGGDVIIARGMNGMGKGKISAGGNVIAKFFENAQVDAGGYVDSDSILHSTVTAKDAVHVGGRKGNITGGYICAANGVNVKNLGSNMGADTIVEVGANPALKRQVIDLQNEIQENNKVLKQMFPILSNATDKIKDGQEIPPEQYDYIKGLYHLYKMKKVDIKKASFKLEEKERMLETSKNAAVKVSGDAYAGTKIVIGDASLVIKGNVSYCRFVRERGDVKMKSL